MNCKNCEYALKSRSLQDNEWYTRCTYEEGECVKITELEKENAELKAVERMALYSKMSDQLAKAKEILADIIKFQPYINRDTMFLTVGNDWKEVIYKAEQFLNKDSTYERIQKAKYNYAD